jgi:alpha-tubulin suppressor-like RCC1 family protein
MRQERGGGRSPFGPVDLVDLSAKVSGLRMRVPKVTLSKVFCTLVGLLVCFSGYSQVRPTGRIIAWGDDTFGQITPPAEATNIVAIAARGDTSMALRADGRVFLWGFDLFGFLAVPPSAANSKAIAVGGSHALALRSDGRVVAWGQGDAGQTNVPTSLTNATAIAAGESHSLAVQRGLVTGWGSANDGRLPPPTGLNGVAAVGAGNTYSVALRSNGTVVVWGDALNTYGLKSVPGAASGVSAIAAGANHIVALRSNGAVVAWGDNTAGQCNVSGLSNVKAIAAGTSHSVYVLSNHTVVVRGTPPSGNPNPPAGTTNVITVAAGQSHSLGLRLEPVVITVQPQNVTAVPGDTVSFTVGATGSQPVTYQWRKNGAAIAGAINSTLSLFNVTTNDNGSYSVIVSNPLGSVTSSNAVLQVNVPVFISEHPQSVEVSEADSASFRVVAGGTPPLRYQWRRNGTNIIGATSSTLLIGVARPTNAGIYTVVVSNNFGFVISQPATLTVHPDPVILIQPASQTVPIGGTAVFSVTASNVTGYQWQKDGFDIPNANDSFLSIPNVQSSHAGEYRVLVTNQFDARLSESAFLVVVTPPPSSKVVVAWGESNVWNGTQWVDVTPPLNLGDVIAVAVGGAHSLALRSDGTVAAWGDNSYGQAGVPPSAVNVTAIAAGLHHSVALRANGQVVAWGRNNFNQTAVPPHTNVVAIAAGADHTLALQENGIVIGWGNTAGGRASPPPGLFARAVAAGLEHSLAVRTNSTVLGWGGANTFGERTPPVGLSNVIAVAAGDHHSFALRTNGTVVAWGQNTFGQTNLPAFAAPVKAIASGANHGIALLQNGRIAAWGNPNNGQTDVPNLGGFFAIAAGGDRNLAVRNRQLRILPPERLGTGRYRLVIRNEDGSGISPEQFARTRVFGSTDLSASNWVQLTNQMNLVSGAINRREESFSLRLAAGFPS